MSKFDTYTDRVIDLATQVGETVKDHIPNNALKWVETGAAVGALRTGTKVATTFVRRNPAVAVAAVAGAGILWYAARRRAKRAEAEGYLEGEATRIQSKHVATRRPTANASRTKSRAASAS